MGGDNAPDEVERLASLARDKGVKAAWYSGKQNLPESCSLHNFDFIKLGAYMESLGGLDSAHTNQRFYQIIDGEMDDITARFFKVKQLQPSD